MFSMDGIRVSIRCKGRGRCCATRGRAEDLSQGVAAMTTLLQSAGAHGGLARPTPTGLADVIDTVLDKGLVIDAYVRVSLLGIELLTIDARVVVASVDTYLRFADAVNRLDMSEQEQQKGLPQVLGD